MARRNKRADAVAGRVAGWKGSGAGASGYRQYQPTEFCALEAHNRKERRDLEKRKRELNSRGIKV